ncbi:hypothetical protein FS749_002742 [Ceratobasidium sp. UAMH 11750]|nr:hypothetical protein FS749_002742 [Ceratobasidium sp. UAMH 11750]
MPAYNIRPQVQHMPTSSAAETPIGPPIPRKLSRPRPIPGGAPSSNPLPLKKVEGSAAADVKQVTTPEEESR